MSSAKKELYYDSYEHLLEKATLSEKIKSSNAKSLCKSAMELYRSGQGSVRGRDEELALIYFMRYINIIQLLQKKGDYQNNEAALRPLFGGNECLRNALNNAEQLRESLLKRYKDRDNASTQLNGNNNESISPLPKVDEHQPVQTNQTSISAKQLFEIIQAKQNNVLIMDCRPERDYNESQLRYSHCVNIPEHIIKAGLSAGMIQNQLSDESKTLWAYRSVKEQIILMDWHSTEKEMCAPISILRNILINWDQDVEYKNPILILDGGYSNFMNFYPTLTTKAIIYRSKQFDNAMDVVRIDDIEYSTIEEMPMKNEINFQSDLKTPLIDRSSKAAAVKLYNTEDLLYEKEQLLDESLVNEQIILDKITELGDENVQKYNGDEAKLNEACLQLNHEKMELEDKQEELIRMKLENDRMRQQLAQEIAKNEQIRMQTDSRVNEEVEKRIAEKERKEKELREKRKLLEEEQKENDEKRQRQIEMAARERLTKPTIPSVDRSVKPQQSYGEDYNKIRNFFGHGESRLAPPPSAFDDFEYHWKQVKNFYTAKNAKQVHVHDTNIPVHLEQMLDIITNEENTNHEQVPECLKFVLTRRPLDLLIEFAVTDSPPGATGCILNWLRRFLKLPNPHLDDDSILQPVIKLIQLCNGNKASPYEHEEILFLSTVAGLVRQNPSFINLFIPAHRCEYLINANRQRSNNVPIKNTLFDYNKVEASIRRISIVVDNEVDGESSGNMESSNVEPIHPIADCGNGNSENCVEKFKCDCDENERFQLLDTIAGYLESADSIVVVRSCEGAMILTSLPSLNVDCFAMKSSLISFSLKISERLAYLCRQIPEDMDTGEIEDSCFSWGLTPRDGNASHFVGRGQLNEFLCWLDYANCLSNECIELSVFLCQNLRQILFENIVEPSLLDSNAFFMLVLTSKIVRQIDSKMFSDELANWLIGAEDETVANDCLLTILIENAQENSNILLPTLQFIESLLDIANERILNGMLFRYLNARGYYDQSCQNQPIQTWSDEEDERERLDSCQDGVKKSRTLAPSNILKIINYFLLLLPRQIMSEGVGTCYEEYVQDANRHYQNWVLKTAEYDWPTEAVCCSSSKSNSTTDLNPSTGSQPSASSSQLNTKKELQCNDSGISEGNFYEGPLLRLLFSHVRHMTSYAYELNLAVIAILSKLAFLPHPYLHEILLNPELPIAKGTNTLWSSMQSLARQLLLEVPRKEGFQKKIVETAKNLLINPPMMSDATTVDESDPLFEALVVLEEFCKELAAIAFVKYHHGTTK